MLSKENTGGTDEKTLNGNQEIHVFTYFRQNQLTKKKLFYMLNAKTSYFNVPPTANCTTKHRHHKKCMHKF